MVLSFNDLQIVRTPRPRTLLCSCLDFQSNKVAICPLENDIDLSLVVISIMKDAYRRVCPASKFDELHHDEGLECHSG